jgi:hypothetical protein
MPAFSSPRLTISPNLEVKKNFLSLKKIFTALDIVENIAMPYAQNASSGFALLITCFKLSTVIDPPLGIGRRIRED